jgi:AAHS family 4-hydroxybenzoate transporter-like MFS transporter
MLHANWGFGEVFTALAIPAPVGAAAALLKGARHRGPVLRVEVAGPPAGAQNHAGMRVA